MAKSDKRELPAQTAEVPIRRGRRPAVVPVPPPVKRGRKAATVEPEEPTVAPPPAPLKRGRKPTADPEEETAKEEKVGTARKGRRPVVIVPVKAEEDDQDAVPVGPVKRGGRKPAEAIDKPQPPRRGRPPKVAPTVVVPLRKATTRAKDEETGSGSGSRDTRRGLRAKPIEVEEDQADPLDSIQGEEAVPNLKGGKKKAVKDEVEDDIEKTVGTRIPKARTTVAKTPAGTKSRVTRKTPATAPPAMVQQGVDKENTPGSDGSSAADTEEPVKVRVSRATTRKAASGTVARNNKVKDEEEDVPEAPRGRIMRATRARTRT